MVRSGLMGEVPTTLVGAGIRDPFGHDGADILTVGAINPSRGGHGVCQMKARAVRDADMSAVGDTEGLADFVRGRRQDRCTRAVVVVGRGVVCAGGRIAASPATNQRRRLGEGPLNTELLNVEPLNLELREGESAFEVRNLELLNLEPLNFEPLRSRAAWRRAEREDLGGQGSVATGEAAEPGVGRQRRRESRDSTRKV